MIGGTYEYLISSLPDLSFQNTEESKRKVIDLLKKYAGSPLEQLSAVEILDSEAQKFLPVSTFNIFQKINLKNIHEERFQKNKSKVLSNFSTFSFELKKELKTWRTSKNRSEKKAEKNNPGKIIMGGTPLEQEIQIMKYQWQKLEEFSAGHFSDLEAVFTYKIKLLILLRWWSFDSKKGYAKFSKMTMDQPTA
ncbi:MAG: DUF2764 family protein [Bacteroidota bacterium]